MPMKSEAQRKMMRAAANNPAFAKKVGVSTKTAKDFVAHDTGGKLPKRAKKRGT